MMRIVLLICLLLGFSVAVHAGDSGLPKKNDELAVPYRFDSVDRWAPVFESPQRHAWQKPDEVIETIGLEMGQVVADIGAATGYFSRRFARAVGAHGSVFAVDIEQSMLTELQRRLTKEGLDNVEAVLAAPHDPHLPANCCDVIFLCNTYHMIAARVSYLNHLASRLAAGGRLVIIDWRKRPLPRGPRLHWKLAVEQVAVELEAAGFRLIGRYEFLPYQYFLIAKVHPDRWPN